MLFRGYPKKGYWLVFGTIEASVMPRRQHRAGFTRSWDPLVYRRQRPGEFPSHQEIHGIPNMLGNLHLAVCFPALKTIDHDFEFCSIESECRVPGRSPTNGLFALIHVNADQEVERSMKDLPEKC